MFAGGVDAHFGCSAQCGHRGGIDDGTATVLEHQRQLVAHALPHALDVDVHDAVKHGFIAISQLAQLNLDTGVVKGAVQATKFRINAFNQAFHLSRIRHITGNEYRIAARRTNSFSYRLASRHINVRENNLGSCSGKRLCRCLADARGRAGYQCYLAGKFITHASVLLSLTALAGLSFSGY